MKSQAVRRFVASLSLLTICGTTAISRAEPVTPPQGAAHSATLPESHDTSRWSKLEWKYPRFRTSEYAITGALLLGVVGSNFLPERNDGVGTWRGGILADGAAAGFLRADSQGGRDRAARISDYLLYGMIAWPYLDAVFAATARKSSDVAWQMALINTQAFALNGLVTIGIKTFAGRERPWTASCDPSVDPSCKSADSFLSGHTSMAFTSAGLTCAHHQALGLYGSAPADIGACAVALAAASATGALRIAADKHYASDVLAGAALGLASGYVLPMLLHYRKGKDPMKDEVAKAKKRGWAASGGPAPLGTGVGVVVSGIFF